MKNLLHIFQPSPHDGALDRSVKDAASALERLRREQQLARDAHLKATERIDRAMAESVELAQDALQDVMQIERNNREIRDSTREGQ